MKKILLSSVLVATFAAQAFAMETTATGTMMKDKMMDDKMMKDGAMMKDDKMMMKDKMEVKMTEADYEKITALSGREKVALLQQYLIDKSYLKVRPGTKLGYYGPLTRAAKAKMQKMMMEMKDGAMMKDDKMMGDKMVK